MLLADEFLCGGGTPRVPPAAAPRRWTRPLAQWLGIGLAHTVLLGLVLPTSPPPRQAPDAVIQANLIAQPPQAKPSEPPKPTQPKAPKAAPPAKSVPLAAPRAEAAPASFVAAEPATDPVPTAHTAPAVPTPVAAPAAPLAPLAPLVPLVPLVPPAFNANYLDNPPPQYPQTSRQRGETGRVLLRVFVSIAGRAERVELKMSSGFERLDRAARNAVADWRFVPARRGDELVAAWVLVPVSFLM